MANKMSQMSLEELNELLVIVKDLIFERESDEDLV